MSTRRYSPDGYALHNALNRALPEHENSPGSDDWISIAMLLVSGGIGVNLESAEAQTPLTTVVSRPLNDNSLKITKALTAAGANPNQFTDSGFRSLRSPPLFILAEKTKENHLELQIKFAWR